MALILSIETATPVCSVALHENGNTLAINTFFIGQSHSTLLVPTIEAIIKSCGRKKAELAAIAVSMGPGSYTGLRIGVSTAKGLCFALGIPLIAVNTLYALGAQLIQPTHDEYLLCPMLDARRMEVYCCILDKDLGVIEGVQAKVVDASSFAESLDKTKVVFFGNGAAKCKEVINHANAIFVDGVEPSSDEIGYLAYQKFEKSDFEDVAYFEPFYLKEFRATTPKARI